MSNLGALERNPSDRPQAGGHTNAGIAPNLRLADMVGLSNEDVERLACQALWATERPGINALIMAMGHDYAFFTSPASVRYHSAHQGGLALHSLLVYHLLCQKNELFELGLESDSAAITGILHDLCKAGTYVRAVKARKEGTKVNGWGKTVANWVEYEAWEIQDTLPIGHGEKSVIMLQRYIEMTDQEVGMIVGHMGGFERAAQHFRPTCRHLAVSGCAAQRRPRSLVHTGDTETLCAAGPALMDR